MATVPYTIAPLTVVVRLKAYEALSEPPEQAPFMPFVLPETTLPIGFTASTPEYLDTAITALYGTAAKVAVTVPFPFGVPCAIHTSTPVWLRPAHCDRTSVQLKPKPETPST